MYEMFDIKADTISHVQCGFCFKTDDDLEVPKHLVDCSHVHCLGCLSKCYRIKGTIKCPYCRHKCSNTPESLPSALPRKDRSILCDGCAEKQMDVLVLDRFCSTCSLLNRAQHLTEELEAQNFKTIPCAKHGKLSYTSGCKVCYTPLCVQCVKDGGTCTNGTPHQSAPRLDEFMKQLLVNKVRLEDRETMLKGISESTSRNISQFDDQTEQLKKGLRSKQEQEIDKIRQEHVKLEKDLEKRRAAVKRDMATFVEVTVASQLVDLSRMKRDIEEQLANGHEIEKIRQEHVKNEKDLEKRRPAVKRDMATFVEVTVASQLVDLSKMKRDIKEQLANGHQVNILIGYSKVEAEVQELLTDKIPQFQLGDEQVGNLHSVTVSDAHVLTELGSICSRIVALNKMLTDMEDQLENSHKADISDQFEKFKAEVLSFEEMLKFKFKADSWTWKYDSTMSDSSSDAGDFYTLPSESISFRAITPEVSEALSQLCNRHSVEFLEFSHDQYDSSKLTILGKDAEKIPQKEIDELLEGTGFSATTQSTDSLHTDLFLNPTLKVTKKEWGTNEDQWKIFDHAACEVLLHAVNLYKEEPHDERLAYFAGPAHMLLTKPQRKKYCRVGMVDEARWEVEKTTTSNRYIIQLQGSTDVPLDMGHPPLFCYNYWCCARTNSDCPSCKTFNEKLRSINDGHRFYVFELEVAYYDKLFDDIMICGHMILNDMILLTLDLKHVRKLYAALKKKRAEFKIGPMRKVKSIRQLREISVGNCPIMIGNYPGQLAPMRIGYGRTEDPDYPSNPYHYFFGLHIVFTLDSEEHELKDGDCGHIVFFKHENGEYQPLGMFIGSVKGNSRVYRAILLHQAISEIKQDYPHHIHDVKLIDNRFFNWPVM